ncbi:MAG: AAA family ATPase [Candidatus Aureabacteria bacterium]|nr:AAA family ATPase [Candidatus Auribacterota bacterium]
MSHDLTIEDVISRTGLEKSRLQYLEARFPFYINRRLFDPEGRFYSREHIKTFLHLDHVVSANCDLAETIENKNQKKGSLLVFASGKGGVGKTTLSVNLSLLAAQSGKKVVFIDGDLGMANAHVLLGMQPKQDMGHLISNGVPLDQIISTTHFNMKFIAGGGGIYELANLDSPRLDLLNDAINSLRLNADWVTIDSPAGIGKTVLSWIGASDELVVVTAPTPLAILDAYGLIKVAVQKGYHGRIHIIINSVISHSQGRDLFDQLSGCCWRFLKRDLIFLGAIRRDLFIERMLMARTPFVCSNEKNNTHRHLAEIAEKLFAG